MIYIWISISVSLEIQTILWGSETLNPIIGSKQTHQRPEVDHQSVKTQLRYQPLKIE